MGLNGFGYEVGKDESLILNIDAKYYKRNESKPFSGIGLFSNGFSYYDGEFKDGMKEGYGEEISLGELYVGEFKGGLFEGKGILKKTNGKRLEGIWKRNEFIKVKNTGLKDKMKIFEKDILIYKGKWKRVNNWGIIENVKLIVEN